jgi:riboflavin biosynthesis pyrimidine reductase
VTTAAASGPTRIHWHLDRETQFPYGRVSPNPSRWEPIGFPVPWPDRPWVFGVMVCSANGVVAWRRRDAADDPVRSILGGDDRPERIADRRHMRYLRSIGDAAVGAQTVREQPTLVLTPEEPGDEPLPELYGFRAAHGLALQPRNIVYSLFGRLPAAHPIFNTPGLDAIVVTTPGGETELAARGIPPGIARVVEHLLDPDGLRRAHQRLTAQFGVRYVACEGGETVLEALLYAGLLDEVFLTVTDVTLEERAHDGVRHALDFERIRAELWAEGKTSPASGYTFRRWRLSRR